ncbi:MAG TPA: SDR family NAD(P)-dependent oxidoreductase [Actinocrinis sp.]|jgi:NADP-dependent 3-hydroxy acid dehydrogenase YdfG|uniref:SDR family NAD(P)-dependent oxidoreductase n=1 Tax=Actinocrinis sp. TaxID=1920516 RepID=UPI002DDD1A26|nr:SDR family NAD(P)-dependent oxidoreductase [Actinocrinis sp.]HEV3173887.1 SDR family NAD(P)-dependent oxidoreductase [Actinocrinis sp.]
MTSVNSASASRRDPDGGSPRVAVVTGASSGIGEATARRLVAEGFRVVGAARRIDRLEKLAAETGVIPFRLDVTDEESVAQLAEAVPDCAVLVNNAGGALGLDPVAQTDTAKWQWMYDVNVLGSVRVTKALLPALIASGNGHVVNITSIAGLLVYEGGAGYTAAKHAQHALSETLRLELNGQPVRITEIAPGMVKTEEFSLVRFEGDEAKAQATYRGVDAPLVAEDIADCIAFAVTRPPHVDIDLMVIKPVAQAAPHKVHRTA